MSIFVHEFMLRHERRDGRREGRTSGHVELPRQSGLMEAKNGKHKKTVKMIRRKKYARH